MKPHSLFSCSLNDPFSFRHSLISLSFFFLLFFPSPFFVSSEMQCPKLNVETPLVHYRAMKSLFSRLWSWCPKISDILLWWCHFIADSHWCIVSLLSFPELRFLLKKGFVSCYLAYICVGLQLNMALHLFLQIFFSLLKHIAVCLFLICYAYKSFKLYVKKLCSTQAARLCATRAAWGTLLDTFFEFGYPEYNFFQCVCIYFSSFIQTSGYETSTVLLLPLILIYLVIEGS